MSRPLDDPLTLDPCPLPAGRLRWQVLRLKKRGIKVQQQGELAVFYRPCYELHARHLQAAAAGAGGRLGAGTSGWQC